MTTREDKLEVGDVFRPRGSSANGFTTAVVVSKEDNLVTVHRPFCYGKENGYRVGMEIYSFWASPSFDIDIIERR